MKKYSQSLHQKGVTLIELLVSMVIGMVIVGTIIGLYVNTSSARRQSVAAAEMNEDGLYALKVLTTHIRLAGYNPIRPDRASTGTVITPLSNPFPTPTLAVFGCDKGFSNGIRNSGAFSATQSFQITCNTGTATAAAIAITYEADRYNTVPTSSNTPTDCLGNGLQQTSWTNSDGSKSGFFYIAENRIYVSGNELFCTGNGGGATSTFSIGQSIVQNVEDLKFTYGMLVPSIAAGTGTATATARSTVVAGYLTGDQVGNASGTDGAAEASLTSKSAADRWGSVATVRICVLMRSATQVLSQPQDYQGCDLSQNVTTNNTDRYLRRAFVTTVNVRNTR